ncbi:MAG: hypothetical protein MRY83_01300 [Flavobacteriales bacterium]|nr:hypothetical protein [Flavobacteriales bacterium]
MNRVVCFVGFLLILSCSSGERNNRIASDMCDCLKEKVSEKKYGKEDAYSCMRFLENGLLSQEDYKTIQALVKNQCGDDLKEYQQKD